MQFIERAFARLKYLKLISNTLKKNPPLANITQYSRIFDNLGEYLKILCNIGQYHCYVTICQVIYPFYQDPTISKLFV